MQNPPPGQGYGNQYGAAPAAGASGKSALGLDGNVAAALGYPIGVIAIINLVMEKENKFVRFHAIQSLVLIATYIISFIVLMIVGAILTVGLSLIDSSLAIIGMLVYLLIGLVALAFFAGLIMAAVKAFQGQLFKLPIVGSIAERFNK
ncbi:MAG: hypothetical protein WCF57_13395 [Pyrinomonadaceae bacterium]